MMNRKKKKKKKKQIKRIFVPSHLKFVFKSNNAWKMKINL